MSKQGKNRTMCIAMCLCESMNALFAIPDKISFPQNGNR